MKCKFGCEDINLSPQALSKHYLEVHPGLHTPSKDKAKTVAVAAKPAPAVRLDADQVMTTVLRAVLFPKREVPIDKLPAVIEWHEATKTMLNALS